MPIFEFKVPNNGPTVEIEAKSLQEAQDKYTKIPGIQGMREYTPWDRFKSGFKQSWGDTAYGAKQLIGSKLTPDQQALIDQPIPRDTPAVLGYMGGELSQLAAPGGPITKAAAKLGRYGPLAADMALNAAHGYVKGVSENESRGVNVAENIAGTGLGRGVTRLVSGVTPVPAAKEMLDNGINLSPGQVGGKGSIPGLIEQSAEAIPIAGSVIKAMRRKGISDWNQYELSRFTPDGAPVIQKGRKGIGEVSDRFKAEYKALLPDSLVMSADNQFTDHLTDIIKRYSNVLDPSLTKRLTGNLEELWNKAADGNLTGANFKTYIKKLRTQANQVANIDFNAKSAFEEALDALHELSYRNMTPEAAEKLRFVDSQYRQFLPVQEAMTRQGALTEGLFTPAQLISTSAGKGVAKRSAARGHNDMVEEAIKAESVLGNTIPAVGPGTGEKVGIIASLFEPNILLGGAGLGIGYPLLAPLMRRPLVSGNLPGLLGNSQVSSQAGQILTDR